MSWVHVPLFVAILSPLVINCQSIVLKILPDFFSGVQSRGSQSFFNMLP